MACLHFQHAHVGVPGVFGHTLEKTKSDNLSPKKSSKREHSQDYGLAELSGSELRGLLRKDKAAPRRRSKRDALYSSGRTRVYRYRGNDVLSIWMKSEARPHLSRQLNPELRIVMGLWGHSGLPTKLKAEIANCLDSGEFIELNRQLRSNYSFTSLDAVRHCIDHGLPTSAAVALHKQLTCTNCGYRTWTLPCLRCWNSLDDDVGLDDEFMGNGESRKDCRPTHFMPGSWEKIEVLRTRFSLSQELWHPDDPSDNMLATGASSLFCLGDDD